MFQRSRLPNLPITLGKRQIWMVIAFLLLIAIISSNDPISYAESYRISSDNIWRDIDESYLVLSKGRLLFPNRYRTLFADFENLTFQLGNAPLEFSNDVEKNELILSLPLPEGRNERYRIYNSPVVEPTLADKYPFISTYTAIGVDDTQAQGRLDLTSAGFHAMLVTSQGTIFIDPYRKGDLEHYISYYARDYQRDSGFVEKFPIGDSEQVKALADRLRSRGDITSGEELRTYRLAVGATGEYSQFHGGNIIDVLSEIVTAINRVTGIYEREVAVRMQLVGNNDQLIFLNPAIDPYSNYDGFAMLNQNVSVLNSIIGSANYDIGHVFSTGGGGVAWLGVVCSSAKAKGVTGLPNPLGDPFYVDYVAHEIGHQFGGNHTFNGSTGSCSGGTRNPSTAYEPGSGSTIMAYAGICGSQNLQSNSDDYFHGINFDEIVAFSTTGVGNSCPSITNTSNSAPHVDAGPSNFTLPANTPFILSGSASDPDNDPLTYSWEEFDLGQAGDLASPQGNAPIVRSFPPQSSPFRIIPRMSDIVNNTQTIGEFLPVYSRNLVFRLTARDNHASPGAGGVAYDAVSFNVTDQAGPFRVTAPNTNESWSTIDPQTVSWNVANTNAPPVNCSKVNILLSTDGGYNYSSTLASNQVNDGSAIVTLPYVTSSKARIKIECADNIFFDISVRQVTQVTLERQVW